MELTVVNRRYFFTLSAAFTCALAFPAAAGGPEAFIRAKHEELVKLLRAGGADNERRVEGIFDSILDYDALARLSLDTYWAERSEKERSEFTEILKKLVRRAYRKNVKKTLDYDITYQGQGKAKLGELVRTIAKNKSKPREEPISIDYVLHQVGGAWRIVDIVTEGSSLVNNYKNQFRRIIKKDGFAELLKKMRKKAEERDA